MEQHIVKILDISPVTHNVHRFRLERPADYHFIPGQATEVAINKPGWQDERRPFTFTGLDDAEFLEFTIKSYADHPGVTNELLSLTPGDEFIIHDVWGAIQYKGEGIFIAGGAGVPPFIAIFRSLHQKNELGNNTLLFANKTAADIILKDELSEMLGGRFVNILSDEKNESYHHGYITKELLQQYISNSSKHIYVCGPPPMMDAISSMLKEIGVGDEVVVVEV